MRVVSFTGTGEVGKSREKLRPLFSEIRGAVYGGRMRPEALFPLYAEIGVLKGVGPRLAPLVKKVAGERVRDLLYLAPQGVIARRPATVATAGDGEMVILTLTLDDHLPPKRPGQPWRLRAHDDSGWIYLTWFKGFGPHLTRQHPTGAVRIVSGKVERFGVETQIAHPDHMVTPERASEIARHEAVYPGVAGLAPRILRKLALEALDRAVDLPEWIDPAYLAKMAWPSWHEALTLLHHPVADADLDPRALARRRLAYDEALAHQLAMAQRKQARQAEPAPLIPPSSLAKALQSRLPFRLTGAQLRTLAEIRADLMSGRRMTRLMQGDVGSGKTVVALLTLADVAAHGGQTAVMAPTEILARQHMESLAPPLAEMGVATVLLTGRDRGPGRAEKLAQLASGAVKVVIGTHALFQDDVVYDNLRLAVIDEQHRFGVNDRRRLMAKGETPHLLALSATPIPRTLELTLLGDLDVSRIDEKPPGRLKVATTATPLTKVEGVIARLDQATRDGAQAFWICPLVAESELMDLKAAEARAEELNARLPGRVGLAHGRLSAAERDKVMADFASGAISILVATTVVEVGVNVPNASILVVEHAERFGLAQLHQLRGRVGRGVRQSACVLLYAPPLGATAKARIEILRQTEDGFEIAERDLMLRGGGDLLGLKQSGLPNYRFVDPILHADLIRAAADDAQLCLARDPHLTSQRGQALKLLSALFDWKAEDPFAEAS